MIIYTNEGNPLALKLQICAKLAKKNVAVERVDLNDKRIQDVKHLPILQLDSGAQIFSSNAAALYLLSDGINNSPISQQWLEWSTTRLLPALLQNISGKGNVQHLHQLIGNLNATLGKSPFVGGSQISVADISLWSLLIINGVLNGAPDIGNIQNWLKNISELPEVQAILSKSPVSSVNLTSIQQSNKFGGIPFNYVVLDASNLTSNAVSGAAAPESPVHNVDVLTPAELELAKTNFIPNHSTLEELPKVVLPVPNKRNILITAALPYVNNVPHLGNIIGCVLSADLFARYARCAGYNTLYIGGTDEYGTATETKAIAEKMTPKQICDKYYVIHNDIYKWFNISFDHFGRTTTPEQTEIVQELFQDLLAKNLLDVETVDQLLCENCDRYLADRFVEGICPHPGCGYEDARGDQCDGCSKLINAIELIKPRCNVCRKTPVIRQSNQFFFNLTKVEPKLREWLQTRDQKWSHNARIITSSWLKEGLRPRCITRDLKWGIPVPHKGFENKVFYVWFDACIGYMSITHTYTKEWRQWWQPKDDKNVELFQFMAKDNVPFHSVMFPCTLIGSEKNYLTVSNIMATEYLNYEDGKFSKSRGTGVFGNDAMDTEIPADVWRFYLASARPEGQDSNFSWTELVTRNNSELLNNLGNFLNRSLVFCEKNFNASVPPITLTKDELTLLALVNREYAGYVQNMERAKFRDGIKYILSISRHGNQYMQLHQPWVLLKGTDDDKARAATVIGMCCNLVCLLASLLEPFMPDTARNIYKQLNTVPRKITTDKPFVGQYLQAGHKIGKPVPLFAKIDQIKLDEMKKRFGGTQQPAGAAADTKQPLKLTNVADAEKAIAEQGEKVRALKASGAEKAVWQPEVQILLDLKKQLTALQSQSNPITVKPEPKESQPAPVSTTQSIEELELKITQQGEKVRDLKAQKLDKSIWTPEVNILLALKKELATVKGPSAAAAVPNGSVPNPSTGKSKKKKK